MARIKPNVLKLKRQRRAWAKSLMRRGMQVPNREVVQQYQRAIRGLEDTTFVDRIADEIKPSADKKLLRQQGELEAWLPQGCDMFFRGPGPTTPFQQSFVYHNSRKDCFVVIHMDIHLGIERRSTTYSSKELLLMYWERDAIQWVWKKRMET